MLLRRRYTETRRRTFPRFYFVSDTDLLDILSNGAASPTHVMCHMPKIFIGAKVLSLTETTGKSVVVDGVVSNHVRRLRV